MKFRVVVVLFNAVVALSVLILLLLPLIVIGPSFAREFWTDNWYLVLILGLVLIGLNGYFLWNRKVLNLMEAEDWSGLVSYLEGQLENGRLGRTRMRLLMNAYLLTRNPGRLRELANRLASEQPAAFRQNAAQLAVGWLADSGEGKLSDPEGLLAYTDRALETEGVQQSDWLRWDRALTLAQLSRSLEAGDEARHAGEQTSDPLLQGLAAYLASQIAPEKSASWAWAEQARSDTAARVSPDQWDKRVQRSRDNLQVVILQRMINDAKEWVHAPD